jgi:hypothetical protein
MFDFLLTKDVINFIEYEEIRTEPILPDQNRKLIDILMLKDENAYQQFLDTLRLGFFPSEYCSHDNSLTCQYIS